jgi:hypothetical protein
VRHEVKAREISGGGSLWVDSVKKRAVHPAKKLRPLVMES